MEPRGTRGKGAGLVRELAQSLSLPASRHYNNPHDMTPARPAGRAAARAIIASLVTRGCREASWQEWTRRSTDDPIAVEARIVLAGAVTERTAMVLLDQHEGALRRALDKIAGTSTATDAPRALKLPAIP